jgi:Flp pilus assembly protein TadG
MPFVRSCIARFLHDRRGNIAMVLGLAIMPLAAVLGLAIDGARGYTALSKLHLAVIRYQIVFEVFFLVLVT